MKIALYFGSFNPMHVGHLTICRYLMENCDIDELRLVVSPANPLKDESNEKSAEERLKHVKKVAANLEKEALQKGLKCKIHVSSIEFKLPKPLYTIDTLRTITEREKGNKLILIIGADNLAIIEKWNRWKELLN
ncbi:MAG TPA: adenylyltransferase/cytidyltransferase family protein, partial [Bacteroidales bacterium]|nr:adenylyltransferase/cytidyltransferase family protein [Bacteroidales bacterium]